MSQSIFTVAPLEFGLRLIVAAVLEEEDCDGGDDDEPG